MSASTPLPSRPYCACAPPPRLGLFIQSDGPEVLVLAIPARNSTVRVHATAWSFAVGNDCEARVRVLLANLCPYLLRLLQVFQAMEAVVRRLQRV
jgi:hypothetical protein